MVVDWLGSRALVGSNSAGEILMCRVAQGQKGVGWLWSRAAVAAKVCDGYYVACKPATPLYISLILIENEIYLLSFLYDVCNKSINIFHDKLSYDEIIITMIANL